MARPIRNTPILTGADADNFIAQASVIPSEEQRSQEWERIEESVSHFRNVLHNLKQHSYVRV